MIQFEEINDAEAMEDYLRNLTFEDENNRDSVYLSHYTTIANALNILNTGYLWLGDYRKMNDPFEMAVLDRNDNARSFYFTSFSRTDESLAMYKMYCRNEPDATVVLQFSTATLLKMLEYSCHGEYAGGISDDGRLPQFGRKGHVVKKGIVLDKTIDASFFAIEIAYLNPKTGELTVRNEKNNSIISPLKESDLIGSVKYNCWSYEQEVRLGAYTDSQLKDDEVLALKLPPDFCKDVRIILGPGFDQKKLKEELIDLRIIGVNYSVSVYEGFYSEITRGQSIAGQLEDKGILEKYIGKSFAGTDKWGDDIRICILGKKANSLIWQWENKVLVDGDEVEFDLKVSSVVNNNLVFPFEFKEKKNIYDDPLEYFYYEYRGLIQLVDDKVVITYVYGYCCSYVKDGSGSDVYFETGSWRFGDNTAVALMREE